MLLATFLTRFLSATSSNLYPQCSTSNITITSPACDLKSVVINTPLNLTWISYPATDPDCLEISVHYRDKWSHEDSPHWIDTLSVPSRLQWLPIEFKDEQSRSKWWKRPGARVTVEIAKKKQAEEVYASVGPFVLTKDGRPKDSNLELLPRYEPMRGDWSGWNDWGDDGSSTSKTSTTATAVLFDASSLAASSYSSTTTKTVTLKPSSASQQAETGDPLSISFALTSIPVTTTDSPTSTATTTLASSDFAANTPSTTSVLSITVNPLPESSSTSRPSSEASTSPSPATAPAASSTSSSSPATRPRPPSLPTFLLSATAVLVLTGALVGVGAREVKALSWRMGGRSWTWPSPKEVKEVVRGTGA